jgi:hypothetical protein
MKTYETTALIDQDHRGVLTAPDGVPPGEHRVIVLVEEQIGRTQPSLRDFPVLDVGPWPSHLSVRREEL